MARPRRLSGPGDRRRLHSGERPSPAPTEEEARLFREAVKDAQPIRHAHRIVPPAPRLPPVPVQSLIDEREVLLELVDPPITADMALETGDEANYARDGVPATVVRKLRRGHWVVQAELDLHGATREIARHLLADFLKECLRRELRCVRVIHGKGLGSRNREPVLKGKVKYWLQQRGEVLAFCQAPPVQGGGGALLVLLAG
jgi:DNA-nicking Smr family endonuclease